MPLVVEPSDTGVLPLSELEQQPVEQLQVELVLPDQDLVLELEVGFLLERDRQPRKLLPLDRLLVSKLQA